MGTAPQVETPEQPSGVVESKVFGFDVENVCLEHGPRVSARKFRRMVEAYITVAKYDATNAARVAGYSWPEKTGTRLRKKYWRVFELAEIALRDNLVMGAREWDETVTSIARNSDHRDQLKALELWGKVIGRVNDKIVIDQDRSSLTHKLTQLVNIMLDAKAKQLGLASPIEITPTIATTQDPAQLPESTPNR